MDMASSTPSTTASSAASPTPMDHSALRSCTHCQCGMSILKYQQHAICSQCRDVVCSLITRCDECRSWSNDTMTDYVRHKKSQATKSKKKPVTSASSSSSSMIPPAVAFSPMLGSRPRLPSVNDDAKIRDAVLPVLHALSQSGSLGSNPISFSTPSSVPDSAPHKNGAAGGDGGLQPHLLGGLTRSSGVGAFEPPSSGPPLPPPHTHTLCHLCYQCRYVLVIGQLKVLLILGIITLLLP